MKKIIIGTLLVLTQSSFACSSLDLVDINLSNVEVKAVTSSSYSAENISNELQLTTLGVSDLKCEKEDMRVTEFSTTSGNKYKAIYTFEDYCDGGNSNGAVYNSNEEMVAHIQDGDFYCIED
jgi:hypothetical protein